MKKVKETKVFDKVLDIKEEKVYQDTKKTINRNLTGEYSHQVIGFALKDLEKKLGKTAVMLMIKDIPRIPHIVVIPDEYLTV